ncbi:MAG: HEAT repeat domain-containing protein [Phycisphaerales bacterium]|jgi:hypothetical protein
MATIRKGDWNMKKLRYLIMIVFISHLISVPVHALVNKEYIQWKKGEFEIPADMKNLTKGSELQAFLDNKREFTRMAAVRRLGEIEGPNAIDLLVKRFAQEPVHKSPEAVPLVKLEIIRTLGRIDAKQAKAALLTILNDYWQKGPNVEDKKNFRLDRNFTPVVPLLLETLYRWSQDKDVFQVAEKIAFSEDVKNFYRYPNGIGQRALEIYLKGTIVQKGIVNEKDSAIYMLDFIGDIRKAGIGSVTLGTLKAAAARAVLERYSEATLSSLLKESELEFSKKVDDKVRRRIGVINKILKEKKEKLKEKISTK